MTSLALALLLIVPAAAQDPEEPVEVVGLSQPWFSASGLSMRVRYLEPEALIGVAEDRFLFDGFEWQGGIDYVTRTPKDIRGWIAPYYSGGSQVRFQIELVSSSGKAFRDLDVWLRRYTRGGVPLGRSAHWRVDELPAGGQALLPGAFAQPDLVPPLPIIFDTFRVIVSRRGKTLLRAAPAALVN